MNNVVFPNLAFQELKRARSGHAPMHSAHEAYAVILEKVEEFKAEVFKKREVRSKALMLSELVQVAAMAWRAAEDLELIDESGTG